MPDGTLFYCGAFLAFIEYKNESGHDGDALMQLARDYHMYTLSPPEECVEDVLWSVCIVLYLFLSYLTYNGGIHFYVLGGFQDGSRTVVEPLARPCITVLDSTGGGEGSLAQLLYSLRKAIIRLQLYVSVNQRVAFPLTECLLGGSITQPPQCSNVLSRPSGFMSHSETMRMPMRSWSSSRSERASIKVRCYSW